LMSSGMPSPLSSKAINQLLPSGASVTVM
jgi:hypothetical protein